MNKLRFNYTNWRGEDHEYLVEPETIQFMTSVPAREDADDEPHWVLNAGVIARDGKSREGRRSFILAHLREVQEIYA